MLSKIPRAPYPDTTTNLPLCSAHKAGAGEAERPWHRASAGAGRGDA